MSTMTQETTNAKQRQLLGRRRSDRSRDQGDSWPGKANPRSRHASSAVRSRANRSAQLVDPLPARPLRKRSSLRMFFESFSLVKGFTLFGFAVAAFLVILFGLDLLTAWPLHRASIAFDINCIACGLVLGYLSWDTFRDQVRG